MGPWNTTWLLVSGFRWAKIALMLIVLILDIVQANVYVDFFESLGKML